MLATIVIVAITALALYLIAAACMQSLDETADAASKAPVRSSSSGGSNRLSRPPANGTSKTALWSGRVLSALVVLFLLFDGAIKVIQMDIVRETMTGLGYPDRLAFGLGLLTLAIAALYAMPRTSVLGAILLTGLLGGAIATHLRVGSPVFSHLLFGAYIGLMAWAGLFLRDRRVRTVLLMRG